ncbi:MAG: response regulator [Alphaproteobacteria bacterium]|nr:response regulator [Alphaproteobacteria bacterium]
MGFYFLLSKNLRHEDLIKNPKDIEQKITRSRIASDAFMEEFLNRIGHIRLGFAYLFEDNDVLILAKPETPEQQADLIKAYNHMHADLPADYAAKGNVAGDFYNYQKLADTKMLAAQRFESYRAMCDMNKIESITIRRERRDQPLILIIEDDRFTSAYANSILSREYDLVSARSGEEGIVAYIENAPDIVFLDIHLPGLTGHETLEAIRAVDPKAYVVMLSVDTAKTNIVQATLTGARNFLKKPFSKERLLHTVRTSPYIRTHLNVMAERAGDLLQ